MTSPADGGGGAKTTVADAAADSGSRAPTPTGGPRTTPAPRAPGMAGWLRRPTAAALALVVVGVAVRVWALSSTSLGHINGDEAVTGIMADRIVSGRNQYIFFAGQQYNGSLEQYLQAAMYWLLRVPQGATTLRYPQVALTALATWLMYLVGRRLLERPWAAVVAAGLFAVGPYWTLARGLGSFGSYPDLIVVGLLAVYAALRIRDGRSAVRWAAVFGACVGLVTWLGLSAAELLIPAGLIAAPYFVRSWRLWVAAVPAVVLGAAPMLWWSLQHGTFALANAGPQVQPSTVGGRFRNLFGPVLREFIGVAFVNGTPGWPLALQYAAAVALGVASVVAVVRHRRGIVAVLLLRTDGRSGLDALLASVPFLVVVYCASKWAWVAAEPRYLYAFSPVLLWCLAAALPARPGPVRLTAVLVGCAVFAATSLTMIGNRPYRTAADGIHNPKAVADFLRANGDQYGYAEYWTAMPILYASGDTLDISSMTAGRNKFPDVTAAADAAPTTFYVAAGVTSTARYGGQWMEQQLKSHAVSYRRTVIGSQVVFDQLSPALKPWQLKFGPGPVRRPAP